MRKMPLRKHYMERSKILLKYSKLEHYFFNEGDVKSKYYNGLIGSAIFLNQTHGPKIIVIDKKKFSQARADGMITKRNYFLGIKTADCLPIFFYCRKTFYIAAVHAGWRGLKEEIIVKLVSRLQSLGCCSQDIVCAIGPHIGSCCYSVSFSLIKEFVDMGYRKKNISTCFKHGWYLDLGEIARQQMIRMGIKPNNIDDIPICTYCNIQYHSWRRNGNHRGRNVSLIGIKN